MAQCDTYLDENSRDTFPIGGPKWLHCSLQLVETVTEAYRYVRGAVIIAESIHTGNIRSEEKKLVQHSPRTGSESLSRVLEERQYLLHSQNRTL